jgi:hypothetical protein
MGLLSLSYTRPKYVSRQSLRNSTSSDSLSDAEKSDATDNSSSSRSSLGIPDSLSFDSIIGGGTCPVSKSTFLGFTTHQPAY